MSELAPPPPKPLVIFAWLMLSGAGCFQLMLVTAPLEYLVEAVTVDDTYLYLQIARHWANLGFPTFDGTNPTSGFQLLWSLVLLVLAKVVEDREMLVRAACLTTAVLNVLTAPLILRLGKQLSTPSVAYLSMVAWCLYLFCPRSPNGMESSLQGVIFALAALVALPAWRDINSVSLTRWLWLGMLLGLNGLCRLDSGIVSAMVAGLFAWRLIARSNWRGVFALSILPALMVGIYFGANHFYYGSPTPVSGRVKMYWAYAATDLSLVNVVQTTVTGTIRSFCHSLMYVSGGGEAHSYPWLPIQLVLITWTILCAWWRGLLDRRLIAWGLLLLIHTMVVYATLQHLGKSYWYYQPIRIWAALMVGHFALWHIPKVPPLAMNVVRTAIVLFACGFGVARGVSLFVNWNPQRSIEEMTTEQRALAMARWISAHDEALLDDARIGSWNAGLVGYFTERNATIVNLDGLVQTNRFLPDVIHPGAWKDYLRLERIDYLVDTNHQDATQTFRQKWNREQYFRGLVPFEQAHVLHQMGPLYLLEVRPWLDAEDEIGESVAVP